MQRLSVSLRHAHEIYGGPRRYFRIFIHDDVDQFREAASRYTGNTGEFDDALGCCHPAPVKIRYDERGEAIDVADPHWGGVLRFVQGHVTTELVAHEMTHAALVVYRMDINADVRLGNGCRLREEQLAYIAGDLIGAISGVLHDAGVWA